MCTFFFFNDTATTEIYTLSLHDALPIYRRRPALDAAPVRRLLPLGRRRVRAPAPADGAGRRGDGLPARHERRGRPDRKSTRLNSSHANISYAVFCLKKKKTHIHVAMYDL